MRKLLLIALLAPTMAAAGWNEIDLPDSDYYQVFIGDKKTRVASSILFWTKEAYVAEAVGENADIDYGSKISRYFADCASGSFAIVHESTYAGFKAKGKTIKVSNVSTGALAATDGSLHQLVIERACAQDEQIAISDISSAKWIDAFGLCFSDKEAYDSFNNFFMPQLETGGII